MLVGPEEAPKYMQETKWKILKDNIWHLQPEKVHKMATDLLQAIFRVFLTCTDWPILQTWKQKKDEYVADVKAHSETLFFW